eukprot:7790924-Lingulodinium_polyedra.AAC.1
MARGASEEAAGREPLSVGSPQQPHWRASVSAGGPGRSKGPVPEHERRPVVVAPVPRVPRDPCPCAE